MSTSVLRSTSGGMYHLHTRKKASGEVLSFGSVSESLSKGKRMLDIQMVQVPAIPTYIHYLTL